MTTWCLCNTGGQREGCMFTSFTGEAGEGVLQSTGLGAYGRFSLDDVF